MNFNRLLYDHQIALMNAATAGVAAAQCDCANHHENLLREARRQLGVAQYPIANLEAGSAQSYQAIAD